MTSLCLSSTSLAYPRFLCDEPVPDISPFCEKTAHRIIAAGLEKGAAGFFPRQLDKVVAHALECTPDGSLPEMRVIGPSSGMAAAVEEVGREAAFGPAWLRVWLAQDIMALGRLFQAITGAKELLVRLEAIRTDACRRFHADHVHHRLTCTYRGPGTQWIQPDMATEWEQGKAWPASAIRQAQTGTVTIMRGRRAETAQKPALLHRSPPVAGSGITRLFLAIDDATDHDNGDGIIPE
ncbi:DUF1826 domain-containing protein [Granulibacter bethesdensis]|nr:DUF1826 domain-containing protein [Granulibacter bethesdensis]